MAAVNMHEQRHVANTLTLRLGNSTQNKCNKEQSNSNNRLQSTDIFMQNKNERLFLERRRFDTLAH